MLNDSDAAPKAKSDPSDETTPSSPASSQPAESTSVVKHEPARLYTGGRIGLELRIPRLETLAIGAGVEVGGHRFSTLGQDSGFADEHESKWRMYWGGHFGMSYALSSRLGLSARMGIRADRESEDVLLQKNLAIREDEAWRIGGRTAFGLVELRVRVR